MDESSLEKVLSDFGKVDRAAKNPSSPIKESLTFTRTSLGQFFTSLSAGYIWCKPAYGGTRVNRDEEIIRLCVLLQGLRERIFSTTALQDIRTFLKSHSTTSSLLGVIR